MKNIKRLKLQHYMAEEIRADQSRSLDNFFEAFIWNYPELKISKNDFLSEMINHCDRKMINVIFEFQGGLDYIRFTKSEYNKTLNNGNED